MRKSARITQKAGYIYTADKDVEGNRPIEWLVYSCCERTWYSRKQIIKIKENCA
jgi:hypothetical protein